MPSDNVRDAAEIMRKCISRLHSWKNKYIIAKDVKGSDGNYGMNTVTESRWEV